MYYINCKSDFTLELVFHSLTTGEPLPHPQFRWEALLYTLGRKRDAYKVACHGEGCYNCSPSERGYFITADRHNLKPGYLIVELKAFLQDDSFTDHVKELTIPYATRVQLVSREPEDSLTTPVVEFPLPYEAEHWTPPKADGIDGSPLTREDIDSIIM